MSEDRGRRATTCEQCGAVWDDRSVRFCGTCGAAVGDPRGPVGGGDRGESSPGPTRPRGSRRGPILAGAAALLLVAGVAAATVGGGWLEDDELEESDTQVELPEQEELDPAEAAPEGPPAALDGDAGGSLGCEPEGCELWRTEVVSGWARPMDGLLLSLSWDRMAEGDQGAEAAESPDREGADIVAIDPDTGETRWDERIEVDRTTEFINPGSFGSSTGDIDERTLFAGLNDVAVAFDVRDREVRWAHQLPHRAQAAMPMPDGAVVLWGERDQGIAAMDPEDIPRLDVFAGDEEAGFNDDLWVTAVDPGSGEAVWTSPSARRPTHGSYVVLVDPAEQQVAAVDPASGDVAWERDLAVDEANEGLLARSLPDDRVLLPASSGADIVDVSSGEVVTTIEDPLLEEADAGVHVQVVGNLLVLTEGEIGAEFQQDGTPYSRGAAVVYHLDQADEPLATYDGTVSAHALGPEPSVAQQMGAPRENLTGYAVLEQQGDDLRLEVFTTEGEPSWQRELSDEADACCASVHGDDDGREVIVASAEQEFPSATRYEIDGGDEVGTIVVPEVIEDAHQVSWGVPLTTVRSLDDGQRSLVIGPEGEMELHQGNLQVVDGRPLLFDGFTLVGLDPEMLGLPAS